MTFSLDVPAGPLAEAALTVVRRSESAAVAKAPVPPPPPVNETLGALVPDG